jgi:hypothetical protein
MLDKLAPGNVVTLTRLSRALLEGCPEGRTIEWQRVTSAEAVSTKGWAVMT